MKHYKTNTTLLIIVFIFLTVSSFAADTLGAAPVILVQLRTEHNKIEALKKAHRNSDIAEVERDVHAVQKRMKMDFRENVTFYPVYYFMDTNAAMVRQKMFDGVLMNADGSPVKDAGAIAQARNYVIVYYGYPEEQAERNAAPASGKPEEYHGDLSGKGLIILNDKFEQLDYVYKLGVTEIAMSDEKKPYCYHSRHYDIEYYPLAQRLVAKLNKLALNR